MPLLGRRLAPLPRRISSGRRWAGTAIAIAVALGMMATPSALRTHVAKAAPPPSVVVILTDDQRWDTISAMPTVESQLVDKGVRFTNAFVPDSLCCPSRTSILTGSYSHTTGVWRNQPPYGGWQSFNDTTTIATWLHSAGYSTALVGKYLNGYWDAPTGYVPPGWDHWASFIRADYYGYQLNVDGTISDFGDAPSDYSTQVLADDASSFIRSANGPLFLYFAPYAPHSPATPAPQYASAFSDLAPWRPPSYDETDVRDKPAWVQRLPLWNQAKVARKDEFRQNQYRTLLSADDAVGQVLQALSDTGRLDNTMIVFLSDNGISWGEHRWGTKRVAYEESIRVPFVVRYDPLTAAARTDPNLVLNIDIAPTIAELTGAPAPTMDGQSLLPLLASPSAAGRDDFLVEHLAKTDDRVPTYCGVRTRGYLYVYYVDGEEELYRLSRDPFELRNLIRHPPQRELDRLRARLTQLCNPPPPGLVLPAWP